MIIDQNKFLEYLKKNEWIEISHSSSVITKDENKNKERFKIFMSPQGNMVKLVLDEKGKLSQIVKL